jgi:hypothetical protein
MTWLEEVDVGKTPTAAGVSNANEGQALPTLLVDANAKHCL